MVDKQACYLDSSALVKRYIDEAESSVVNRRFSEARSFVTSSLTYAEMYAVIGRAYKEHIISRVEFETIKKQFEADWSKFLVVDFSEEIRKYLPKLIKKIYLRGADLVHLVTVYALKEKGLVLNLLTYDVAMLKAASLFGIRSINSD